MGGEFRKKGATIALGPLLVGPLGRIALGGRNWEGFINNPYLSGSIRSGISSCDPVERSHCLYEGFFLHDSLTGSLVGLD